MRRGVRLRVSVLAGAVCLLLIVVVIAGCGAGPSGSSASSTTTTSASGQSSTTVSTANVTSEPVPPQLAEKALKLVDLMNAGSFAVVVESFDETMKKAFPAADLEKAWAALEGQVGEFRQAGGLRMERANEYRAVIVQSDFAQAKIDIRIVFDTQEKVAGLFFQPAKVSYTAPAYVDPARFAESDVTVVSRDHQLPGTLSMPAGDGPFPAVVLVHGSGPNDRDETVGPNKPFRDIAQALATDGIAVLRYDKRTFVYQDTGADLKLTVEDETVDDAVAAYELLRGLPKIDREHVFVLGHSLGGMMLPRIAGRTPEAAGLVFLAAAARPLEDMILEQSRYLLSIDPQASEEEKAEVAKLEEQVRRVKDASLSPDTPADQLPLAIPASYWLDLRGYDPAKVAQSLKQDMLFAQGGRDYQVTMEDFEIWRTALNGRPGVDFAPYPDLNHLFQTGEGKSKPAEYLVENHVAEGVVDDISEFILERSR